MLGGILEIESSLSCQCRNPLYDILGGCSVGCTSSPSHSFHEYVVLFGSQQTVKNSSTDGNISDHLTCLLRNLYEGQEATVRTGHGTTDWFKIEKGVCPGYILSLWLFNFCAEYIMWNARLDESQAGIKIAREISITSDMQMTPPLWQKVKRN